MEKKIDDKKRLFVIAILFTTFIVGVILWSMLNYLNDGKIEGIDIAFIALILAIFGFKVLKDKYRSVQKDEPLQDEMSKKIETKAAAYAFYIGLYWLLGLSYAIDAYQLSIPASSVPSVGIAGLAIIFGLSYGYLSKKGE